MNKILNKIYKILIVIFLALGFKPSLWAQSSGYSYEFLNLAQSARVAALGAEFLSISDNDISLAVANPSLIGRGIHNSLSVNYVNYFSGINYGFVTYSYTFNKVGSFAATLQFANYGKVDRTDVFGNENGYARAGDFAFVVGWGRELDTHFSIGANLKMIYTNIDRYNALGMAVDVSATYSNRSRLFSTSLLLRNMGGSLLTYSGDKGGRMPFEVAVALSQKIPHAPFRLLIELPNLQKWRLNYNSPYAQYDLSSGGVRQRSKAGDFFDNLMRHTIFGLELIPYKGFYLRAAYNYDRGQNMTATEKNGMVGFSWGFGIRVYRFNISYARNSYHLVGSPNFISVAIDIDAVMRKGGFKNMKWND